MIDCDAEGRFAEYCTKTGEVERYRVVFLDPNQPTTQLIPASQVRRFATVAEIKLEKKVRSKLQLVVLLLDPCRNLR